MKKNLKKITAVLLAAALLFSVSAVFSAAAAETQKFVLNVRSNFFPEQRAVISDLSKYADANGDVFLTVSFKMTAMNKYLVNLDVDGLTWDNEVLEFKEANNTYGSGRNKRFTIFPFAVEQNLGSGMMNTFGDNNGGRAVGNCTSVRPAAYAYEEDGSAINVVKAKFRVLDLSAGEATVTCNMDTLSLCEDTLAEPTTQYTPIKDCKVNQQFYSLGVYETVITPNEAPAKGDPDGDGKMTINDATEIQRIIAEQDDCLDLSDRINFAQADVNGDNRVDIRDVTEIQRGLAGVIVIK